jgi:hypothetical protein
VIGRCCAPRHCHVGLLPACVKSVLYSLIWTSLIVAVFAPLSVCRYKRVGDKK